MNGIEKGLWAFTQSAKSATRVTPGGSAQLAQGAPGTIFCE